MKTHRRQLQLALLTLLVLGGCSRVVQQGEPDGATSEQGVGDGPRSDNAASDGPGPVTDAHPEQGGDLAATCNGLTCPLGCQTNVTPMRCRRLLPTNGDVVVTTNFDQQIGPLTVNSKLATTIDTKSGEIRLGSNVLRTGGLGLDPQSGIYWWTVGQGDGYPELSVFIVSSLVVAAGETLEVKGTRALVIYSKGDVSIDGTIVTTGVYGMYASTPGGFTANSTCFGGEGQAGGSGGASGSGGGGSKAAGGSGGAGGTTPGGAGGAALAATTPTPFFGGCGGAGGNVFSPGGHGGGAIQISANGALTVGTSGVVNVPGGGGSSGCGGGAGGLLLLEAGTITVQGTLAANGGAGGGESSKGEEGKASSDPAANAEGGGNGGAYANEAGSAGLPNTTWGGGGGGSVGWIQLRAAKAPTVSGVVSPKWVPGPAFATW